MRVTAFTVIGLLVLALLTACAARVGTDPYLAIAVGDAYLMECEEGTAVTTPEGEVICPESESIEVRGAPISEGFTGMIDGLVGVVSGLLPRGVAPVE